MFEIQKGILDKGGYMYTIFMDLSKAFWHIKPWVIDCQVRSSWFRKSITPIHEKLPTCVCVFIFLHREGFFRLQDVQDILERDGSTILCCEYLSGCFLPSSFISISESIIFHLQRRNSNPPKNWREFEMIYWNSAKRWCLWI